MLTRYHLPEHGREITFRQGDPHPLALLGGGLIALGGIGKAFDETVEYLTRRRTRKCKGDNPLRLSSTEDELKQTCHKRERLARSGRCLYYRKSRQTVHAAKTSPFLILDNHTILSAADYTILSQLKPKAS
jgi:hypothetical protein